jgi:hypothetical protein
MVYQRNRRQFSRIGGFLLVNFSAVLHYFSHYFKKIWSIKTWEGFESQLKEHARYGYFERTKHFVKAHISFENKKNLHVEKLHKEFLEHKSRQMRRREDWIFETFQDIEHIKRLK